MAQNQYSLVTLKHSSINSGNAVAVLCSDVKVGYSKTNSSNPNANYSADTPLTRVQTQSISNPIYVLSNVKYDPNTTSITINGVSYTVLTLEMLKDFFALENDDTNPITLKVTYGSNVSLKSLHKYSGVRTANIPVTFNGRADFTIDTKDSKDGYLPVGSINLLETKKTS